MQYPNGMQLGTRDGNVGWNAVVMWTNIKDKDETKKDKQAHHIPMFLSIT